jgi:Flp pilus assembly protein TadG
MNNAIRRTARPLSVLSDQQGAIAILVALSLTVLIPMLAFVIDIGQALVVKQSLQNLADAAALAGARQLGRAYETRPPGATGGALSSGGQGQVSRVVADVSEKNQPPHHTAAVSLEIGKWNAVAKTLSHGEALPDGVRVSAQAQVPTFVASAVGVKTIAVSAVASAALTGLSHVPSGTLVLPLGFARGWIAGSGWTVKSFTITRENIEPPCAAWSTFDRAPATQQQLQTVLEGIRNGGYSSPAATGGQTKFQFLGSQAGTAFADLLSLYSRRKSSQSGEWVAVIPLYDRATCESVSGSSTVVGFATAKLVVQTKSGGSQEQGSDKEDKKNDDKGTQAGSDRVIVTIIADQIRVGRGGGTDYGTKGSIPGLVN